MELIKSEVKFKIDGKEIQFYIIHNLPNMFGLSFNNALHSWLARTKEFTSNSLVEYIDSKNTGYVAMTEFEYENIYNLAK